MKVSLNTIKQYVDITLSVDELVEKINKQLGGVEEVVDLTPKYKDVIIVKVVECEKHPNADKLSVCMIDDGGAVKEVERDERGLVRVVCGAPNAHAGMFAAWLPPKSTVPASYGEDEPFVLDTRELRGIKSNGMLAAADELDLGTDHAGIIEINPNEWKLNSVEIKPGTSFAEAYGLNDVIIDIENKMFTHRPDCFGQLGVAREIFAITQDHPATDKPTEIRFKEPDWYWRVPQFADAQGLDLTVTNEIPDKSPRFMTVAIRDVTVGPSPLWLQIELVRLGSRAINNIVDVTNYVMLLTGQPTHAYDYDKLRGQKLGVRMAHDGEKTTLLNDKTYTLNSSDIVIVDGEGIVGLGGVMGGGNSEVSAETKNVVLECANFDMYNVRKTSMRYGLFTDAVTRFSKGQSSLQQSRVLHLLMTSLIDVAGGTQASNVFDLPDKSGQLDEVSVHGEILVKPSFINDRLGLKMTGYEIGNILRYVSFAAYQDNQDDPDAPLSITAPFWRTDIEAPEDIIEEVGRLYGFDKLPVELPVRTITPAAKNRLFEDKQRIRTILSRLGANEVLTYSFVHENMLKHAGQDAAKAFRLGNALSPDLQYYRLSLTPSLLDKIHPNSKTGHERFALFEIGLSHDKDLFDEAGLPIERKTLALVYTSKKAEAGAAFYRAKRYLRELLLEFGVGSVTWNSLEGDARTTAYYEPKRAASVKVDGILLGYVGEYRQTVVQNFKLPAYTAGFEIDVEALQRAAKKKQYVPLSRFPKVTQDISLKVDANVTYGTLFSQVWETIEAEKPIHTDTRLEPLSIYQTPEDKTHKTITLRLSVVNYDKTLTDKDVSELLDKVTAVAEKTLGAVRA